METQTHRIINRTQGSLLSEGVQELDATFEHLTVLRVLIEGLADNHEAGLWLTQVKGIPAVPRISPFDLIYVDEKQRVVEAVELLPAGHQPPFEEPAVSALVLPFQTISATQTRIGDQLVIDGAAASEPAEHEPQAAIAEFVEPVPVVAASPQAVPAVEEPLPVAVVAAAEGVLEARPAPDAEQAAEPEAVAETQPVAEAELVAEAKPAAEAKPVPEAKPVAEPRPVVQSEMVASPEPVLLSQPAARPAKSGGGKKKRNSQPRARKGRRLESIAERNWEAAEAERRARTEAALAQTQAPAPAPPFMPQSAPVFAVLAATHPALASKPSPRSVPQRSVAAPIPASAPAAAATVRIVEAPVELVQRGRNKNRPDEKTANERGNIMAAVNRFLHWLNPEAVDKEQRSSIRRPARELAAFGGPEGEPKKHEVGDISSTGVYLRTEDRWEPGTKVALTLQRNGPEEHREDKRVEVEADTVRWGKDGVALEFAFPEAMRLDLWEAAAKGEVSETGPDYIVHEMRLARALGVFRSICPEVEEEVTRMLRKEFSSARVAGGIRIALMAERLLRPRAEATGLRVPAGLLLHVLEMGSWADEEWTQAMWAGLMASACTREGGDESNAQFAQILSHMAPAHLRVLEMACGKAMTAAEEGTQAVICTIGELTRGLDLTNLTKTLRTVAELGDHGLMAEVRRSPSDPLDTEARTSATRLGLMMYARCHGQRGDEEAFVKAAQLLPGSKA
jgi:hypothetical protein